MTKYNYTKERENELYLEACFLIKNNKTESLIDIFKIDLNDSYLNPEKFYMRTVMLMIKHNKYFVKRDKLDYEYPKFPNISGGYVELNSKYTNVIINNITQLTFNNFYPNVMSNSLEEFSNIEGYKEMYSDLIKEYSNDKKNYSIDHRTRAKTYINSLYGCMLAFNDNAYIKASKDMSFVTKKSRYLIKKIASEFSGHLIYADTDSLFFIHYEEIQSRLEESFSNIISKYNISKDVYNSGFFLSPKKYFLLDENNNQIIKGIKTI